MKTFPQRLAPALAATLLLLSFALAAQAAPQGPRRRAAAPRAAADETTLDLRDFGAVGDGVTDDAPALRSALDALAAAGGGTLHVPAGRYALDTPVAKDFSGLASSVTIRGVESQTPVNTKGAGQELTRGLDLTSEFLVRVGAGKTALTLSGLETLLVHDLVFIGVLDTYDDALVTLRIVSVADATVRHCEFYGLSSVTGEGGAIVHAHGSGFTLDQSVFLGTTGSSGVSTPVVLHTSWHRAVVTRTIFADYGQRADYYGKLGLAAPFSWLMFGDPAPATNLSPRREAVVRDVFLDEGALIGVASMPDRYNPQSDAPDLVYVSDLRMNVSNLHGYGVYAYRADRVLIERSHFGWSSLQATAVDLSRVGEAVIDRAECVALADTIRADALTGKLTVINSTYTNLQSQAAATNAYTTATEAEDDVQHVRSRYLSALAAEPDPAGHSYWSDRLLACGDTDDACEAARRAELDAFLAVSPPAAFSIRGRILDEYGAPLAGAAVALSGTHAAGATTDAAGDFVFAGLPTAGVYGVAPALAHYTFEDASVALTTPGEDQAMSFAATLRRYRVAGRVRDAQGLGIPGAAVTIDGPQQGSVTTGADGAYDFAVPALGDYEVTVARANYTFDRTTAAFDSLTGDRTADFTGALNNYKISGRVTEGSTALAGVAVALSGSQSRSATTDAKGDYSFNLPAEGAYTVTPTLKHYTFSPAPVSVASLSGDRAADFSATRNRHSVTARVTDPAGANFAGVTVTLSGSRAGSELTGANGAHTFASLPAGGAYTVTPSRKHYTFTPVSKSFDDLGADGSVVFAAKLNTHAISGRVTNAAGQPVAGAVVTLSGGRSATATSDSAGNYSFTSLPAGANYALAVARANYAFEQPTRSFTDLSAAQTADFRGSLVTYTVAGRVTIGGAPAAGVAVALSGSQSKQTTTDAGGNYSFAATAEGDYTVTPSKPNHAFLPGSLSFAKLGGNQTADFAGTLKRHAVVVRVANANNYPLAGVPVALSGSESRTVVTDASGIASFTNLAAGGTYTVRATLFAHTFSPAERTFTNLAADQWADLLAVFTTYTISGRVMEKGGGAAGVSVVLSGAQAGRVLTGANGAYSFTVPAGGDYAVEVYRKGSVFFPASVALTALGGNRTVDFKVSVSKSPPGKPGG